MALTPREAERAKHMLGRICNLTYEGGPIPVKEGGLVFRELTDYLGGSVREEDIRRVAKAQGYWPYEQHQIEQECQEHNFPTDAEGTARFLANPFGDNF